MDAAALKSIADSVQWVAPEITLVAGACFALLVDLFVSDEQTGGKRRTLWGSFTLLTLFGAMVALYGLSTRDFNQPAGFQADASLFLHDVFGKNIRWISLWSGVIVSLLLMKELPQRLSAELFACLIFIIAGVNVTAIANDLTSLFLGLELVSVPTYVLLALIKPDLEGREAALKYFLLSIFSSAIFLFGAVFFYGATGSTNLTAIREAFAAASKTAELPKILLPAFVLVVAGLGFRVTLVPFHFYAPDVFAGSSTGAAAMLAQIPKITGFAAIIRLFAILSPDDWMAAAGSVQGQSTVLLWWGAIVTMIFGNVLALQQTSIRRLLAYSSVAHAGYMLAGAASLRNPAANETAGNAVVFYLAAYGAMTLGLFCVLSTFERNGKRIETINDLRGLFRQKPMMTVLATLFLFSLTGLPPTAGFFAKYMIFISAWTDGSAAFKALAFFIAVNAAVGAWYYLRLISVMYFEKPERTFSVEGSESTIIGAVLCAVPTIAFFLLPSAFPFR